MEYGISLIFFSVKAPEAYRYLLGQANSCLILRIIKWLPSINITLFFTNTDKLSYYSEAPPMC